MIVEEIINKKEIIMFPNNLEFFLREKEAERQAAVEQIRLLKLARAQGVAWQHCLGKLAYRLGGRLIDWGIKLQQSGPTAPADKLEGLLS
jgi:hypothetical protein